jgi:hypothetical protein
MIKDAAGTAFPASAGIFEASYQFAFLGVDAHNGQLTVLKTVAQLGQIFKLEMAAGAGVGGDLLAATSAAHRVDPANTSGRCRKPRPSFAVLPDQNLKREIDGDAGSGQHEGRSWFEITQLKRPAYTMISGIRASITRRSASPSSARLGYRIAK